MGFNKNQQASVCFFFFVFLFFGFSLSKEVSNCEKEELRIKFNKHSSKQYEDIVDSLLKNVTKKDILKYKEAKIVSYSDFGAKGDGKTDDINAIVATHEFANKYGLKVKANDAATYYISGKQHTVNIQTSTDFGLANFIIDDTNVENPKASVFEVNSKHKSFKLGSIHSLKKNQKKIEVSTPTNCLVIVTNASKKQYIRFGLNQNNGHSQTDIFLIDTHGKIDDSTPILWDFDTITNIQAFPIDDEVLKITGGRFTTMANKEVSKYNYYQRNIRIKRSNVIVDGLAHYVVGEENQGAPYGGFLFIRDCANITVKNTILTAHKTYKTIGNAGEPVSMGTYDLQVNNSSNVLLFNCTQTNDIKDGTYWGIMASNYSKNLTYDTCVLSRFDAHMGVYNATIRNSTLGHAGINLIGFGTFRLENSKVFSNRLINLRRDYGSTWQGNFIIRNCIFVPSISKENPSITNLFIGFNNGEHDFGYTCYMPQKISIENLYIDDSKHLRENKLITIFDDFNPKFDTLFKEKFPYIKTKKIILKNVTTASGKIIKVSENLYMFNHIKVKTIKK